MRRLLVPFLLLVAAPPAALAQAQGSLYVTVEPGRVDLAPGRTVDALVSVTGEIRCTLPAQGLGEVEISASPSVSIRSPPGDDPVPVWRLDPDRFRLPWASNPSDPQRFFVNGNSPLHVRGIEALRDEVRDAVRWSGSGGRSDAVCDPLGYRWSVRDSEVLTVVMPAEPMPATPTFAVRPGDPTPGGVDSTPAAAWAARALLATVSACATVLVVGPFTGRRRAR